MFLLLAIVGYVAVGIIGAYTGLGVPVWEGKPQPLGRSGAGAEEWQHLSVPGSLYSLDPWGPSKGNLPY